MVLLRHRIRILWMERYVGLLKSTGRVTESHNWHSVMVAVPVGLHSIWRDRELEFYDGKT